MLERALRNLVQPGQIYKQLTLLEGRWTFRDPEEFEIVSVDYNDGLLLKETKKGGNFNVTWNEFWNGYAIKGSLPESTWLY